MNKEIRFLNNTEIDIQRWDQVVGDAVNSRVYALSWYLNILHHNWHGLIYGDYDYVMPVIFSKKWGISYMYQPVYAQQHGIFPPSGPDITERFISFLQKKFRYFNISLNTFNEFINKGVEIEYRKNYILYLDKPYTDIWGQYSTHTRRYVKKANSIAHISTQVNPDGFLRLKTLFDNIPITDDYMSKLRRIVTNALEKNKGLIYEAYSDDNELCAAAFFIKENKRITYLNSVSSPEAKRQRSMYAIVDAFIRDHTQQPIILDFEGSNIEGIARFFEGFGAQSEIYQHIKFNNLPWFLKLFKR
jgi:hypothetical protein